MTGCCIPRRDNNMSPEEMAAFSRSVPRDPAHPGFAMGRAFLEARPVHFATCWPSPTTTPARLRRAAIGGAVSLVPRGADLSGGAADRRHWLWAARGPSPSHRRPESSSSRPLPTGRHRPRKRPPVSSELETRNRDPPRRGIGAADRDAEVLQVINSSARQPCAGLRRDARKAMRLCCAAFACSGAMRKACSMPPRFGGNGRIHRLPDESRA